MNIIEIAQCQEQIIRLQSGCIDELFCLLAQHIEAEELEKLECLPQLKEAGTIKKYLNMD